MPSDGQEHKKYPFFYFIPSEGRIIEMGEVNREHQSIKTPKGIVWMDYPYLNLTAGEETKALFDGKEIEYFRVTDEIIAVSLMDQWNPELQEYRRPVYYATWEDMKLKQIADPPWPLGNHFLEAVGYYIVFEDFQDRQGGYRVYNTKTDESWFTAIEDIGSVELAGLRMIEGEPEIILKKKAFWEPDQQGYYVINKASNTYYQHQEIDDGYINPQFTHYMEFSWVNDGEYGVFSIRPFFME